jgi:hypothetical protein
MGAEGGAGEVLVGRQQVSRPGTVISRLVMVWRGHLWAVMVGSLDGRGRRYR